MNRAAILLIFAVGCGTHQSAPPPKVVTITSLTDAARRLELLGYRHDDNEHVLGQHFVNYKRETPDAVIKVSIVRWEDDQRIKDIFFHCRTNYVIFDSDKRLSVMSRIQNDACALVDGRGDYLRAQRDAQKIEDNGLARYHGQTKDKDEKGNKITLAQVALTHVATKEDMTPIASQLFCKC